MFRWSFVSLMWYIFISLLSSAVFSFFWSLLQSLLLLGCVWLSDSSFASDSFVVQCAIFYSRAHQYEIEAKREGEKAVIKDANTAECAVVGRRREPLDGSRRRALGDRGAVEAGTAIFTALVQTVLPLRAQRFCMKHYQLFCHCWCFLLFFFSGCFAAVRRKHLVGWRRRRQWSVANYARPIDAIIDDKWTSAGTGYKSLHQRFKFPKNRGTRLFT